MSLNRQSCDAISFATNESRANLQKEHKDLKRIYHRKMQIIGRDSNGTLLSKKEQAELKMAQAK